MKNLIKSKVCLAVLFALFIGPLKQNAQVAGWVGCVGNSSECDVKIVVDFFCNGLQITNNTFTVLPKNTTFCPSWPSWATNCSTCDMQVTLIQVGAYTLPTPQTISINNPGPIPMTPNLPPPHDGCIPQGSNGDFVFSNGIFWIFQ